MTIQNIIVHEVQKNQDVHDRKQENPIDGHAENLSSELSALFRKTGLNTGQFEAPEKDDDPVPHFVTLLNNHWSDGKFDDFVAFSVSASEEFKRKLDDASASALGGYLLFNHYTHGDEYFLSVVLLRKKNSLSLGADLSISGVESIDLDKLHMAARINLTKWIAGDSERYVSFQTGKKTDEVRQYFSRFIGCIEYTQSSVDTNHLVDVTVKFCCEQSFDADRAEAVKQFVFERCIEWMDEGKPVYLDSISKLLDTQYTPEREGLFLELAQAEPFNLTNEISVRRTELRRLTRYAGRDKRMSISFKSDLYGREIQYDPEDDSLTIFGIPEALKAQLQQAENDRELES